MKNIGKIFVVSAMLIGLSGSFVYADVFTDLKTNFKSSFPRTTAALNRVNGYVQNKMPEIKFSSYSESISGGFAKFAKIESPTKIVAGLVAPLSPALQYGAQLKQSLYTSLNDKYNSLSSINLKSYSQDINSGIAKFVQYASPTRIVSELAAPLSPFLKSGVQLGQNLYTSLNDQYTKLSNFNLKSYAFQKIANFNSSPSLYIAMKGLFSPLATSLKYSSSVGKGFSNSFNGTDPLKLVKFTQIR